MERTGLKIPLLIGGATTSKMHTAVKVAPNYPSGFAMHVLDASRAVSVCESLLNDKKRDEFKEDVREQYEELRGTKTFKDYDLKEMLPYIDWNPFFRVWQLRGKYPNRGYPKIFQDETVGEEAKKLHADAMEMLKDICAKKTLKAKGVVGIWPANAVGDDIEVYAADGSGTCLGKFHTLRQQEEREDSVYYAMSDFIAPKSSGKT